MKKLLLGAIVAVNLVGCASVNMGTSKQDAEAKKFSVSEDKSAIYIYRNESFGSAVKMDIEVNGQNIGHTAANTFLYKELPPGRHIVASKAENADYVEVNAKPGSLHYIWQEVKMGILYARTKLHLVDEAQGKKGVLETQLAETK